MTRTALVALAVTLTGQSLGSLALSGAGVIAPDVAPRLGHAPESVGVFVGLAYLAAMISGLFGGQAVARLGAVDLTRLALLGFAAGLAGATLAVWPPFQHGFWLLTVAMMIGIGYGFLNPSASPLLNRHTPAAHRALIFSIKQAGVPIGVALAGLVLPFGLAQVGWPRTSLLIAGVCVIAALLMGTARRRLEPERQAARPAAVSKASARLTLASVWRGMGFVPIARNPELRWLVLATYGLSFSQLCFVSFLVSYLMIGLGFSLAAAAGVLAIAQIVSSLTRVLWGAVADRWIDPSRLVGLLGLGAGAAMAGLGWLERLDVRPGLDLVTAMSVLTAMTAMSWNGVFMAALTQRSGPTEVAAITGASQFVTFFGSMTGPLIFAALVGAGLSWGSTFLAAALLPAAAGLLILAHARARRAGAGAGAAN